MFVFSLGVSILLGQGMRDSEGASCPCPFHRSVFYVCADSPAIGLSSQGSQSIPTPENHTRTLSAALSIRAGAHPARAQKTLSLPLSLSGLV